MSGPGAQRLVPLAGRTEGTDQEPRRLARARTVNDTDDVAFFWTREAEAALDMNALRRADPADLN